MSRKSLILCLAAVAVLLAGLAVSIAFLYSGTKTGGHSYDRQVSDGGTRVCFSAVPSDAVLVSYFSRIENACTRVLAGQGFPSALAEGVKDGTLASLRKSPMAVSLHYAGKISALYVICLSKTSEEAVASLGELAKDCGMYSEMTGELMVVSASENLIKSAVRHHEKKVSVCDAPGFGKASASVGGSDVLLVSNVHARKLMLQMFSGSIARQSSFVERVSDWLAFDISSGPDTPVALDGMMLYDGDPDEFASVLEDCQPAVSGIGDVLPSYTLFALSLPVRNPAGYADAYKSFLDSRQGLQTHLSGQKAAGSSAGIMPEEFFARVEAVEVGSASFIIGSRIERVNLIHVGNKAVDVIFKGTDVKSLKGYSPSVHQWAYPSFAASVYGRFFRLRDESHFTYLDGWIVSGSKEAVEEYVSGGVLEYTLNEFMTDAGKGGLLSGKPVTAAAYFSFTEDKDRLSEYFTKDMLETLMPLISGCDTAPAVLMLGKNRNDMAISFAIHNLSLQKTKAPSHERDTVVTVPSGPFKVKNSHTGKMNTFYQNAQKAICLRDENGKDLWGVPFGKPLCGTAHNVDYYANGKLQIIFGAGSSIYVIDRLGRYVTGFPLDLGKEIVLGPDVYDFSGARRYNIMVLHDDNTIQMYNLKGRRPEAWKGIAAEETIKALPERLIVGGKDFWIVRTSIQTLIFPFYGGDPLTVFEGNAKIRPDSQVTVADGTSVQAVSYDGKTKTIRLI